jgi:hypothetical protein
MIALLIVLDRFKTTGKDLWMLPPVFALWVNLHASWVFGLIVLALTIAARLVEGEWSSVISRRWTKSQLKALLIASAASIAALFFNPFGYKLVLYPFDFLFHQQSNAQYVEEWQSVDLSTGNGKLALLVIFGLLAAGLLSRRRWRLDDLALCAFALWAGLSHARFLFFLGLIVVPILAPRINLFSPYDRSLDKPWLNAGIMTCVCAAIVVYFPSTRQLQTKVDHLFPTAALQFMNDHQYDGRIFNQYFWGGYMEWTTPQLKPLIDGRADIFVYNGVLDDHRRATLIQAPLQVMDKYRIEYALLQPNQPLTYFLQHVPGWRTLYSDDVAVVLQRESAAPVATKPSCSLQ